MRYENNWVVFDNPRKLNMKFILKKILSFGIAPFYRKRLNFISPNFKKKLYYISVCSIFRDEAPYLKEWIEFHKLIGVEHFYLYNNFSADNYMDVLQQYINEGVVTLTDWPHKQDQMGAFADCVKRFSNDTNWICFIDLDEFIVPNQYDKIGDFLRHFSNRPVVIVQWRYFGTSGIEHRDLNTLVTESFTKAWPKYSDIGKVIFNTSYDYWPESNQYMHSRWAKYKGRKLPPVNCFDKICLFDFNPIHTSDLPIQINHYLLKSRDEYMERKARRGGGVHGVGFHDLEYFDYHEKRSSKDDRKIFKYMDELKERMDYE